MLKEQFRKDMRNVHGIVGDVTAKNLLGAPFPIKWSLMTDVNFGSPSGHLIELGGIRFGVGALPAVKGEKLKSNAVGGIGMLVPAPIFATKEPLGEAAVKERIERHAIERIGGPDAKKPAVSLMTLATHIDDQVAHPDMICLELAVVLPGPQTKGEYFPNFCILIDTRSGEYGATLVIDDRLVSRTPYLCGTFGITALMDYSDSGNHRYLEATGLGYMDRIELAALTKTFNSTAILLTPVKQVPSMLITSGPTLLPSDFGFGSRDRLSYNLGATKGGISSASWQDARVSSGAKSGLTSTTTTRDPDTSRPNILLLVRTMVLTAYENIEVVTNQFRSLLDMV